jgi:hypothetical protein
MTTAEQHAANMTQECRQFLVDLTMVAGNEYHKPQDLILYHHDMYTWFKPSQLLYKYTKQQIGGFLSYLQSIDVVCTYPGEHAITEHGVDVAIANARNYYND